MCSWGRGKEGGTAAFGGLGRVGEEVQGGGNTMVPAVEENGRGYGSGMG